MLGEATIQILSEMGVEYVRVARRELNVKLRIRSKTTGKFYNKKISTSGKLSNSFKFKVNEDGLDVTALDYAQDVSDGTPRASNIGSLAKWIRNKPVRLRTADGRFIEMKTSKIINFAKFIKYKLSNVGSDRTGYLDGILDKVYDGYSDRLEDATAKDVADELVVNLKGFKNLQVTQK